VEGQEWTHAISYIGSPDGIADVAPEMDAIADRWFKICADAGLRNGVCIRPPRTRHGWYNAAANEIIKEIYERNYHPKRHASGGD